ncbi:hypothetical protein QUF74_10345 [Candidatus Halobeggiatoa sp. HSG11]|nr:hypothetical protein [Candidatus Halobeggiatoa sp. HSG11]
MLAYKQNLTIKNPKHLELSDLPLKAGQQVEVIILVKEDATVINPAQTYTDSEWEELKSDERRELETQYVLNNPVLMKQISDQSEWFNVSANQLDIED